MQTIHLQTGNPKTTDLPITGEFKKPQDVRKMTDDYLESNLKKLVQTERRLLSRILEHILEVERRNLHLKKRYNTIAKYLVGEMGYSQTAAYRRMEAAWALRQVPDLKEKVEEGKIHLCQIVLAEKGFKESEKINKEKVSAKQKAETYQAIENKTFNESQKIVDQHMELPLDTGSSHEKHRRNDSVDMHLNVPRESYVEFQRVRNLYSHIAPGASWLKVFELMAKDVLKQRCPVEKENRQEARAQKRAEKTEDAQAHKKAKGQKAAPKNQAVPPNPPGKMTHGFTKAGKSQSPHSKADPFLEPQEELSRQKWNDYSHQTANLRFIPAQTKRYVFIRDEGKCQFKNKEGHICGSEYLVQVDHIQPVFAGGTNDPENLRVLCRAHNQFRYKQGCNDSSPH